MSNRGFLGVRAPNFSGRFSARDAYLDSRGAFFVPITATGGTISDITVDGRAYRMHKYTSTGTSSFVVTDAGTDKTVEYLVVSGGGSGVRGQSGGFYGMGGTGGGVRRDSMVVSATSYTVIVGTGGATDTDYGNGNNGGTSTFGSITAELGQGGINSGVSSDCGDNRKNTPNTRGSGSGGGGYKNGGANGGYGTASNIEGTLKYYAGGGAGWSGSGRDGGGNGPSGAGTANTGGGGAGGSPTGNTNGGAGGSGIVIIRYPLEAA
jgi:hypothetical protein